MSRATILAVAAAVATAVGCTTKEPEPEADAKKAGDEAKADTKYDAKADAKAGNEPRGKQVPAPDDVAAPPADAKRTESGLAYKVLQEGSGDQHPASNDAVEVSYTGWTTNGATFDTTDGTPPRTLPLNRVIPGWAEGIQLMRLGEKTRLWIPEQLAYRGSKGKPAGMLVFDIELHKILAAPPTPEDVSAPPADAEKTKSGLAYKRLEAGKGKVKPRAWDKVKVHYSGWTTDGKMFDSSVARDKVAEMTLVQVIPGWTEGVQLMVVGDKVRFWIPKELAYKGAPGKPPGMLVFDIELIEVTKQKKPPPPPPPPKTPKDVKAPPASAKKTDSGLAYKVLKKGKGKDHPPAGGTVTVHYSGWTTDGKMFDSSVVRGQPAKIPLGRVIKGWSEGLQLMVVGDKTRFWIPEALAYKGAPGKPAGMLVFDVQLIEIAK